MSKQKPIQYSGSNIQSYSEMQSQDQQYQYQQPSQKNVRLDSNKYTNNSNMNYNITNTMNNNKKLSNTINTKPIQNSIISSSSRSVNINNNNINSSKNNILQSQKKQFSYNQMNLKQNNNYKNSCKDCGLNFQSISELLNHQRKFCINSGYDDLKGLLLKQTRKDDSNLEYLMKKRQKEKYDNMKPNNQRNVNNSGNKNNIKTYGEYSLSKFNINTNNQSTIINTNNFNKNSRALFNDMKDLQYHKMYLEETRPYQHYGTTYNQYDKSNGLKKSSISQLSKYQSARGSHANNNLNNNQINNNNNSRNNINGSAFSYRLDKQNFKTLSKKFIYDDQQHQKQQYNKSISPATDNYQQRQSNLIHVKQNPASIQFKNQFTVLNKSNTSIANMQNDKKYTYAKIKLDQLGQIKELYLKNGGQSKEFKENIQKMIKFYQKLVVDCSNDKKIQSQTSLKLSIASRPETPITKLNDHNFVKSARVKGKSPQKQQTYNYSNSKNSNYQNNSIPNFYDPMNSNPYAQMASNYANLYNLKVMQDMMRLQAQQNKKLIQALIQVKNTSSSNSQISKNKQFKLQPQQQDIYRFSNQIDPSLQQTSQDKILKLLQQQQLDQLKLIAKLPTNLQDQKINSLITNSELRHKMQKQVLKQKIQKLNYQQKLQCFEEERLLKNQDWVNKNKKHVLKDQMKEYMEDFSRNI